MKAAVIAGVLGIVAAVWGSVVPVVIIGGKDDEPPPPAAVPATPTPTLTPTPTPTPTLEPGTYSGITSQGRPVEFDVVVVREGRAIGRISFSVEGTCPVGISGPGPEPVGCACEVNRETTMTSPWPIADAGFSYAPGEFEFSAIFDSTTTASGFVRIHTSGTPGVQPPCESGQVTWTASVQ